MSKNSKPLLTLHDWCEDLAQRSAIDLYNAFESERDKIGDANYRHLVSTFVAGFISAVVYRSLLYAPASLKTEKARVDYAYNSFNDMKLRLQEAVAAGFAGGMRTWSGKTVDYYCQVKVVPDPVNKEMC